MAQMELEIEQFLKFTKSNQYLLIAQSDNKGKVFDTVSQTTQQFLIKNEVLNSLITCADIFQNQKNNQLIAAFGNSKGQVVLYDINKSEKLFSLQVHSKSVLDIAFDENGENLYTLSGDKFLKQINLKLKQETFSKEVKKRGFIEHGKLLFFKNNQIIYSVDNKMTLLNSEQDKEMQKFNGHSQNIQQIKKSIDGRYFISFSNEGYINLYSENNSNPLYTINVLNQSKVVNIELKNINQKKSILLIQHVDQIVMVQLNQDNNKFTQTQQSFKLLNPVIYTSIDHQNNLQVAHGTVTDLKFKQIGLVSEKKDKNGKITKKMTEQTQIQEILNNTLKNSQKVQKQQIIDSLQKEQTKNTYVVGENDFNKEQIKELATEDQIDDQKEQLGILSHLKEFNLQQDEDANNVKSLAVVLLQGLHNNDQQLLDFCLDKEEDELIDNTIKKLLASKVGKLVENITDRLSRYPYKANILCKWLKYIIKYHNSILIATPKINERLGPLLTMIESRTKNLNKIIALRGKIDMVLSLKRANQIKKTQQNEEEEDIQPIAVYKEGEDEEELEDLQVQQFQRQKRNNIDDSVSDSEDEDVDQENDDSEMDQSGSDIDKEFEDAKKAHMMEDDDEDMEEEDQQGSDYMEF